MLTFAPATTLPTGSSTVPAIAPVSSWALAGAANHASKTTHASHAPKVANPRFRAMECSTVKRIEVVVISASSTIGFVFSRFLFPVSPELPTSSPLFRCLPIKLFQSPRMRPPHHANDSIRRLLIRFSSLFRVCHWKLSPLADHLRSDLGLVQFILGSHAHKVLHRGL